MPYRYGTGNKEQEILIQAAAEVGIDKGICKLDNQVMDNIKTVGDKTNCSQRVIVDNYRSICSDFCRL